MVVAGLLPWVAEVLCSIPLPAKHLSSWWSGRIEHDHHHRGVVRSQLAHPPSLHGKVHQLLARVLPLVTSSPGAALQHVHLVVLLRRPHRVHRHLWTQHIPGSISPQDKTALLRDIDGVDMQVRLWGDNKDVLLAVVAPEVAQSPGNGQEGNLVNRGGAPNRPCVPELRSVPNNAGHSGLVHHLQEQDALAYNRVKVFEVLRVIVKQQSQSSWIDRSTFPPAASIRANSVSSSGLWSLVMREIYPRFLLFVRSCNHITFTT